MFGERPPRRAQIDLGLGGPIPRDIVVLMGILVATFSLDAFASTRPLMAALRLGPQLWTEGYLWQLVTYPFIERYADGSALWMLLSLWMIFVIGKQILFFVGRRAFWRHFFTCTLVAGVAAVMVQLLLNLGGWAHPLALPFGMMSGFAIALTFLFTAFAVLYGHATIYVMFVLPVKASWFLGIEALLIFIGFLSSRDLAGFVGLMTILGVAYFSFSGRSPKRFLHELRMRAHRKVLEARLRRMRSKGAAGPGSKGKAGGDDGVVRGPWVN